MSWGIERLSFQGVLLQPPAISFALERHKTIVILAASASRTTIWIISTTDCPSTYNKNQKLKKRKNYSNNCIIPLIIFGQYEMLPTMSITICRIRWATRTRTVTSRSCMTSSISCLPLRGTAAATIWSPWSPVYEKKKI